MGVKGGTINNYARKIASNKPTWSGGKKKDKWSSLHVDDVIEESPALFMGEFGLDDLYGTCHLNYINLFYAQLFSYSFFMITYFVSIP